MLIALLVLSFGLLGVAGLQAVSLKNNHAAYLRTQANILAYEIIDRMRANHANALNQVYNYNFGQVDSTDPYPTGAPSSSDSVALQDLTDWLANLRLLPQGAGAVSCNADRVCVVGVEWDDTRGAAPAPQRIYVSTEL
jgi:type IV pilus assembly protein PilV